LKSQAFDAAVFDQELQTGFNLPCGVGGLEFTGAKSLFGKICGCHIEIHLAQSRREVIGYPDGIVEMRADYTGRITLQPFFVRVEPQTGQSLGMANVVHKTKLFGACQFSPI